MCYTLMSVYGHDSEGEEMDQLPCISKLVISAQLLVTIGLGTALYNALCDI